MRLALHQKLFLLFFPLFLLSVAATIAVVVNIRGLSFAGKEIRDLKDFEIAVRHMETFNWGLQSRMAPEQQEHFAACVRDLEAKSVVLREIASDLPVGIEADLALLGEQTAYYRSAFEELQARQRTDREKHEQAHEVMEGLSTALSRRGGQGEFFAQLFFYWGQAYHDRSLDAILRMRELTEDLERRPVGGEARRLAAELMRLTDENYLNQLGIIEKETFLDGTGKRFAEVSSHAVSEIRRHLDRRQRVLFWELGALGAFTLFLMAAGWYASTRHVRRFLARSHDIVGSIERGDYAPRAGDDPDDEFGDLLHFLRRTGDSLKASIERVHASEERYRRLVEEISAWVWETDEKGVCTYSSPVARRLIGLNPEEVRGRLMADFLCSHGDSCDCRKAFEERRAANAVESSILLPDGTPVMLESSWDVLGDETGAFRGFRGISTDVTERVLAEEERRRLQEHLHHAQKMEAIGTLSGGVAHDFNNLLQAMGGYAEMILRRESLQDADRNAVERIIETIGHAGRLTRQLLLYSRRIESEVVGPIDLNVEVAHAKELLERTIPKMIRIETVLGEGLPPILADSVQIEQVLLNLGVNARDVMPGGGTITIRTSLAAPDADGRRRIALAVSDTGPGVPKEIVTRIFEPFFTTKEVGKGTGLGLAIVYGIAQSLGATVSCESEPGQGATFTLLFHEAESRPPAAETAVAPETSRSDGTQFTVLVADDEFAIRETSQEALQMAGYRVLTAANGEEAIELYRQHGADVSLVILDLNMPGMGGAECLHRLKELDPAARVVIATGFSDSEEGDAFLRERSVAFLRKPFRLKDLVQTVQAALGR